MSVEFNDEIRKLNAARADRFHSFRAGFRDAVAVKDRDGKFIMHATRPDIADAYNAGYDAGSAAYDKAMRAAQRMYKWRPSILRESP